MRRSTWPRRVRETIRPRAQGPGKDGSVAPPAADPVQRMRHTAIRRDFAPQCARFRFPPVPAQRSRCNNAVPVDKSCRGWVSSCRVGRGVRAVVSGVPPPARGDTCAQNARSRCSSLGLLVCRWRPPPIASASGFIPPTTPSAEHPQGRRAAERHGPPDRDRVLVSELGRRRRGSRGAAARLQGRDRVAVARRSSHGSRGSPTAASTSRGYALPRIADGAVRRVHRALCPRAARPAHTIYMRPMHEMNGNWYPWGGTVNGNSPETFKRAWRRMHDIFRREGADNVRWVFTPINEDWPMNGRQPPRALLPRPPSTSTSSRSTATTGARRSRTSAAGAASARRSPRAYRRLSNASARSRSGSPRSARRPRAATRPHGSGTCSARRAHASPARDRLDGHDRRGRGRLARAQPAGTAAAFRPAAPIGAPRKLRISQPVRLGRRAGVAGAAWTPRTTSSAGACTSTASACGRCAAERTRVLRKRMHRTGRYSWTVRGVDVNGRSVVSASRRFRVVRPR